ncbi:MAG TPA: DoxX family membrane protein [Phycisphaerales bacterium]|nr:DoxX family membrane protein [Phycisphaerales bacterium]
MASSGPKPGPLVAPLLLRLAIGVTFVWAGLGKLVPIVEYKGQDAAILANLGTGVAPTHPVKPITPSTEAPGLAPPPTLPLPEGNGKGTPPKSKPSSRQSKPPLDTGYASSGPMLASLTTDDLPAAADTARTKTRTASAKAKTPPAAGGAVTPSPTSPTAAVGGSQASAPKAPAADTLPPGGKYTASDFPEPAKARRAYGLSVLMVRAAYPQPTVGVQHPKAYWPAMFAASPWVVWLAFGAAVTELFAGVLLLVGFLTRLSALMIVSVMLTAMWLTQIGPAISTGQTTFGILPDKTWWDPQLWTAFFWQLLIIASGVALAFSGAGALSVDRALAVIGSGGPKSEQDPASKG